MPCKNAGFDGFRVLLFKDSDGIKAASGEPGLKFTIDFGFGMLNAMHLGDVINDLIYQIRPYEVNKGETDRVFREAVDGLCEDLKNRDSFEIEERAPDWAKPKFKNNKVLRNTFNVFGKWHEHMWGKDYLNALHSAREKMDSIEVDRTRVKPMVKITGEFWAQTTEGDGNFNMFNFLEREGAQVMVEPIGTWVHVMYQAKAHAKAKWPVNRRTATPKWTRSRSSSLTTSACARSCWGIGARRAHVQFRLSPHHQAPGRHRASPGAPIRTGRDGASLLQPVRSGRRRPPGSRQEHLLHLHKLCHMVLSLKPFGCMPSTQSDGAQSAVVNKFKDMIFLPIETSGEGEINAHSRVQMALGEAKNKAKKEFEQCSNLPA